MNISITFDHRDRTKNGKEGPVEVRITHERKRIYISTGVRVRKSEFNMGEIINRMDAPELNELLQVFARKTLTAATRMLDNGDKLTGPAIRKAVFSMVAENGCDRSTDMVDWMEAEIPKLNLKPGTLRHYVTMVYRLKEFGQMMSWSDLTVENVCNWDEWLHQRTKKVSDAQAKIGSDKKRIADSGVYNYHKCFKAMLNRALLFGKIQANPYDRLKGKFKRGDDSNTEFLTEEQMRAVESIHPVEGSTIATARDLFVFQMHTGLSYADTQSFDFRQYERRNGHWVNIGNRDKNGVQYVTQLDAECEEILKRYKWNLPKICNADYNKALKAIGMAAGIDKPLHSHLARHSFATYMLANGAQIQNVSKMLGHTNIKQTQRYAKVLAQSVLDDFNKIEDEKKRRNRAGAAPDDGVQQRSNG
jgi:integrase/recombinase XerD